MLDKAKAYFDEISPKKKRNATITAAAVIFFTAVYIGSERQDRSREEVRASQQPSVSQTLLSGRGDTDLSDARLRVRLRNYETQMEETNALTRNMVDRIDAVLQRTEDQAETIDELEEEVRELSSERETFMVMFEELNRATMGLQDQVQRMGDRVDQAEEAAISAPPPSDTGTPTPQTDQPQGDVWGGDRRIDPQSIESDEGNIFDTEPPPPPIQDDRDGQSTGPDPRDSRNPQIATVTDPAREDEDDAFFMDQEARAETYVTPGSIISGVMITGLDASTSPGARRDTTPALIRITDTALMANYWEMDIRECMGLVSGYGSISDERAHLTGDILTCITHDGDVVEAALPAYVAGQDGSEGVRGNLVMRQGAMIRRATVAAFSEALADVFGSAFTNTPEGIESTQDLANLMGQAGAAGMSNSFSRLADYWIDMAESISPIIEVRAGTPVELITTQGIDIAAAMDAGPETGTRQNGQQEEDSQ